MNKIVQQLTARAFNEYRVIRKGKVIKGETRMQRNAAKAERRKLRGA